MTDLHLVQLVPELFKWLHPPLDWLPVLSCPFGCFVVVVVDGYALAHSHFDLDLWSRLVDVLWEWFRGGRVNCVVVLRRGCGGVVES